MSASARKMRESVSMNALPLDASAGTMKASVSMYALPTNASSMNASASLGLLTCLSGPLTCLLVWWAHKSRLLTYLSIML